MFKHHSKFHTEEKGREIKDLVSIMTLKPFAQTIFLCFHDNCEMMAWIDSSTMHSENGFHEIVWWRERERVERPEAEK